MVCHLGHPEAAQPNCPVKTYPEVYAKSKSRYSEEDAKKLMLAASYVESTGYMKWTRVQELIEFARFLKIKSIGIASCVGLQQEGSILTRILEELGFNATHVCCKTGAFNKEDLGIPKQYKLKPEAEFEAACNPIVQAGICNKEKTELNVIIGLCIGHDILFTKFSEAPVTTLIVKDRVTGHNPAASLYSSYHRSKILGKPSRYPPAK
jgi:uncharacterized metal-binding protein